MFAAIKSCLFWSVILLGVFFTGRLSVDSPEFNNLLDTSKATVKTKVKNVLVESKGVINKIATEVALSEAQNSVSNTAEIKQNNSSNKVKAQN